MGKVHAGRAWHVFTMYFIEFMKVKDCFFFSLSWTKTVAKNINSWMLKTKHSKTTKL